MNDKNNALIIFELLDIVRRNWWTVIAGICLGLIVSTFALSTMPKLYQASATLYLAPPKIPTEYVDTNVQDEVTTRLWRLSEAVLSDSYMLELISNEFVMPSTVENQQVLIKRIRGKIEAHPSNHAGYFDLRYTDYDAQRAARVVNILADLFIREVRATRTERARSTTNVMSERADEARLEMEVKRKEIDGFRFRHRFALSTYLDANWRTRESSERGLLTVRETIKTLEERLQNLRTAMAQQQQLGSVETGLFDPTVVDPYTARLRQLESALEALLVHYSDQHPSVKAKRRELEEWRALQGQTPVDDPTTEEPESAGPVGRPTPRSALADQIRDVERQLEKQRAQETKLQRDMAEAKQRIEATPGNDQKLAELRDGFGLLQGKYGDLLGKAEDAESTQWLEESEHGRQFQVADRAEVPLKPVQPQPLKVYLVCLLASIALMVAPPLLYRLLNPLLTSVAGLESQAEVAVLVSIPRIPTDAMVRSGRVRGIKNVSFALVSIAACAAVFFTVG